MELASGSGLGLGAHGVPWLKGKENFNQWKYMLNLVIRKEKAAAGTNKKKDIDVELDLKIQTLIATKVSKSILASITDCATSKEMLDHLDWLYGLSENDLATLHNDFQNFQFDNEKTFQENVAKLESIKSKIETLGHSFSDFAFRTRLLSSLLKRFHAIVAACSLNGNMDLEELISAMATEDHRLTQTCGREILCTIN